MADMESIETQTVLDGFAFNDVEPTIPFAQEQSTSWAVRGYVGTGKPTGSGIRIGNDPRNIGPNPVIVGNQFFYFGGQGTDAPSVLLPDQTDTTTKVSYNGDKGYYTYVGGSLVTDQKVDYTILKMFVAIRQTLWDVVVGCRGAISYQSEGRSPTDAFIPYNLRCRIGTKYITRTPGHTGLYGIISQTPNLYLDERGSIYRKSDGGYLGFAGTIDPYNYASLAPEIIRLQKAWNG